MKPNMRTTVLPALVTIVVAISVISAIVVLGGPSAQRQRKMDEVRVRNLASIAMSVNSYFARHSELPADLDALAKEPGYRIPRNDPDTGQPYGYQVLGAALYRLCGDFTGDSATDSPGVYNVYMDVNWSHGSGHQCFERNAENQAR